ncbi:hypothetical protein CCHL11_09520 [Colletotrichum chlorophyti]|uniref:Uncharacterized protein n=1 Tax=Colletotrichum chlorophyti TaxID=708187 RepID=A0A1Q8RX37_9PEZI|nr:hypothetical protein CCHL11_09520 [Colletotrichum chlorophyti]
MSTNLRPLLPQAQDGASDDKSPPEGSATKAKGMGRVCDGQRPSCGRCKSTKHECAYEVEHGETRMQGIRKANRQMAGQIEAFKSLFGQLKSASDDTKAQIMAHIAVNDSPEVILQRLKEGKAAPCPPSSRTSSHRDSRSDESRQTSVSSRGASRSIKMEHDDELPAPQSVVSWQGDKMHFLLQRVANVDLTSTSLSPVYLDGSVSPHEYEEQKSPELLHAIIRADQTVRQREISDSPDRFIPPGAVGAFGNLPLSSAIKANNYPPGVQARQLLNVQMEEYRFPSFIAPDGSPLSNLFYSYKDAALEMLSNGVPSSHILGPMDHIDLELFFRDRQPHDAYDVHSWACEITKSVDDYDIFVKLASTALYMTYMRWNILPTATNYALMPEMIRPTRRQRFAPHHMNIDLVPHPAIRDALISRFRDWLTPGTTDTGGTSVGWPYSLDAAVDVCPVTGRRMLSRAFYEHATNAANWSLDKSIRAIFPEIEGMGFKLRA